MSSSAAAELRKHTAAMAGLFESRVSSFKDRDDILGLLKSVDKSFAVATAKRVFGEGE
jgi:hypothetical protein